MCFDLNRICSAFHALQILPRESNHIISDIWLPPPFNSTQCPAQRGAAIKWKEKWSNHLIIASAASVTTLINLLLFVMLMTWPDLPPCCYWCVLKLQQQKNIFDEISPAAGQYHLQADRSFNETFSYCIVVYYHRLHWCCENRRQKFWTFWRF